MGNNRYGSDTRLCYAVTAPLRGACTCGRFDGGGALMGMFFSFTSLDCMEETNNRHLLFVSHRLWTYGHKLLNCVTWSVWEKAGGSTYGHNRHSFATLLRSGVFGKNRGGATYMGNNRQCSATRWLPRYAVHGHNRHSFATLLRSGVFGKNRGVQHIWAIIGNAPLRGDCPATRCMHYWAVRHRRCTYGDVFQIYHV